ncbi:MAG TPA: hypothetical protein VGB63_00035 [Pedobacter sp.]
MKRDIKRDRTKGLIIGTIEYAPDYQFTDPNNIVVSIASNDV